MHIDLHYESRINRLAVLYEPGMQMMALKNEIVSAKQKYFNRNVEELNNYEDAHEINEKSVDINDMLL